MIMVDEPGAGAYYGGVVAAPYGKIFYSELFKYLGAEKDDPSAVAKEVIMPKLEGLSVVDAVKVLMELKLEYELDGFGTIVKKQLPPEGSVLYEGDSVVLML